MHHSTTSKATTEDMQALSQASLDMLLPLHLQVGSDGFITHAGPTLQKIWPDEPLVGLRFLEVFELRRPVNITLFRDLLEIGSDRVRLVFRSGTNYMLKGLFVQLPDNGGLLFNLSLGVSVVDAVARFDLSSVDFAPSDPTVDMLYLIEAKSVALDESKRLNARLQGAKTAAEEQAFTDTLTGLRNRRALDHLLERLQRDQSQFGLMHLDLDFFKQVNDTLGHAAGDHVLRHVANVLIDETRAGDLVARVGGDEFVLIFNKCVDLSVLDGIAMRIIARLEEPIHFEGHECKISASIGTTLSSFYDDVTANKMLNDADMALYMSKEKGRAQHTIFEPSNR